MAHHVFISYSDHDKSIADKLCSVLEGAGLRCWLTPRDVLPGGDWAAAIVDAIAVSRVMVLLLSASSNESPHVKREVERAVHNNVIIIPFRIENVTLSKTLEYHLSTTHWMDACAPPLEKHLETLTKKSDNSLSLPIGTGSKSNIPGAAQSKVQSPKSSVPARVTLTIMFHGLPPRSSFRSFSDRGHGVDVIFDGKHMGTIAQATGSEMFRRNARPALLRVETTPGVHSIEFPDLWDAQKGPYKLTFSAGGSYKAIFSQPDNLGWKSGLKLDFTREKDPL